LTSGQEPNRLGEMEEVEGKSDPQVLELHRLGAVEEVGGCNGPQVATQGRLSVQSREEASCRSQESHRLFSEYLRLGAI
jgi:hypothetical protein